MPSFRKKINFMSRYAQQMILKYKYMHTNLKLFILNNGHSHQCLRKMHFIFTFQNHLFIDDNAGNIDCKTFTIPARYKLIVQLDINELVGEQQSIDFNRLTSNSPTGDSATTQTIYKTRWMRQRCILEELGLIAKTRPFHMKVN